MPRSRPKRLPHNGVDRVKPTCHTVRKPIGVSAEQWAAELDAMGPCLTVVPRVIVWVDTNNHKARGLVKAMLHRTGVKVQEEHPTHGEYRTALVISGSVEQLHSAIAFSCVVSWELVMSARVGHQAQGGGPEKVRNSPSKPSQGGAKGSATENESRKLAVQDAAYTKSMLGKKVVAIASI